MVFLADLPEGENLMTYGLFGVQHGFLNPEKRKITADLYSLLVKSAGRVDHLQDQTYGLPREIPKSTTFVAYWLRSEEYQKWIETGPVKEFWASLSEDAGVWREVMTVPKSRFMHASSQNVKSGIATLLELKHSTDEGYWGVYRHRLSAVPDNYTDPSDTFASPWITSAKADGTARKFVINIPKSFVGNNIVFVREGQRQPHVSKEELDTWLESIAPHAKSWIEHLDTERNKNGVVAFTTHIGHESPAQNNLDLDPSVSLEVDSDAVAETNQLAYFLDLAHFEMAGRTHLGHVKLRKNTMTLYGPGGKMSMGKAVLYVELGYWADVFERSVGARLVFHSDQVWKAIPGAYSYLSFSKFQSASERTQV
ncbi:hypothetical protein D0Z07_7800 [Hyphodiscus hymeniophilus]|uniref:Aldoxime dehydratase n=1 Tax=Hyphodiscus hymeniophilus TaxID=353542 RepID=A0A9P6SQE4_9HELO|nr:hypothetical protein D0Z07_7800 [Hyphodiscus hymeniophilus]